MPHITELYLRDVAITHDIYVFLKKHSHLFITLELSTMDYKFEDILDRCSHLSHLILDIRYKLSTSIRFFGLERFSLRGVECSSFSVWPRFMTARLVDMFKMITAQHHFNALEVIQLLDFKRAQIGGGNICEQTWTDIVKQCRESGIRLEDDDCQVITSSIIQNAFA